MTRRRDLPDALPPSFRVADAKAAGVRRHRLDASDLTAPFTGMRSRVAPPMQGDRYEREAAELRALAHAYLAVAPPVFAFSHVTAARLYGMPLPRRMHEARVLDIVTAGRAVRREGIHGHSVSRVVARRVSGIPIVLPELAWLQVSSLVGVDDLVVAGDHLVRRKRPLSTVEQLRAAVSSFAGKRGARTATAALELIRAGTDSPPETRLRLVIVRAGLPEPLVGYEVLDDGYWVGTPDLAYPDRKVAVEYQGGGHREEDVYEDDIHRLERFHDAGWTVIQVTKAQLRDPIGVVNRVRWALAEGSTRR